MKAEMVTWEKLRSAVEKWAKKPATFGGEPRIYIHPQDTKTQELVDKIYGKKKHD